MGSVLYFAYGSNMLKKRISTRIPVKSRLGIGKLDGYKLAFHKASKDGSGKCDIVKSQDGVVYGVLYEIDTIDKSVLDRIEGLHLGYNEMLVTIATETGESKKATTYFATKIDNTLKPYSWYLKHVLEGAIEANLPSVYISELKKIDTIKDPDSVREKEQLSIYNYSK